MMRQPGLGAAVSSQSLLGNADPNRQRVPYDIANSNRFQVLLSSKKNGLPKDNKLKGYLCDVVTTRVNILKLTDKRFRICDFQTISLRLIAREKLQLADDDMSGKLETSRFLKTVIGTEIAETSTV